MTSNPFRDRLGGYAGVLGMLVDITARKQADLELERSMADLEKRVEERTRSLSETNQRLMELTYRDELTGLYNRRYLQERLGQEAARSKRHRSSFCLLFMDIDHFKGYNDRFGHVRGDDVLKRLGRMLMSVVPNDSGEGPLLRTSDVAARWGGEEFVVFAPETSLEGASVLAERLRKRAPDWLRLPQDRGSPPAKPVTLSIGVSAWGSHAADVDGLIVSADNAMYAAKRAGRNRVCLAAVPQATASSS
jgi:two-component system, sensor histidine kinase LadS